MCSSSSDVDTKSQKASVLHADCRVHLYIHTNRLMDHRQNALRKQMLVHSGYILFFLSGVRFY